MYEEDQDEKWIPFNVSYDTYKKILNSIYRKKGDIQIVSVDVIASGIGIMKRYVSTALLFLKSLKIVDGDTKSGYKFTVDGITYTKALLNDEKEAIAKTTLQLINQSHLKKFQDFLEINKTDLTLEKLFKQIKIQARMPEGKRQFGLDSGYIVGIKTLIKIFQNAALIPDNIDVETMGITRSVAKTPRKQSVHKDTKPNRNSGISVSADMEQLAFGKSIIVLPKQNLNEEWEKLQKHMKLYLENLED